MKFLIAGFGSIGRRHFRNLLALGERDILLYRTRLSTLPEDELQGFPVETDLSAALAQRPDCVIVSNPTALHLEVAIPAARQGCHLLIEKPISHSLERIDELQAALHSGGGKALVGFQFRFHPGLQWIKRLLSSDPLPPSPLSLSPLSPSPLTPDPLGRPLSFRAHWGEYLPAWHPWEDYRQGYSARADLGGGVILTLSHPFDYLRWLFGEVEALWAFSARLSHLSLDVEDTAEIGLRYQSKVLGSLHLDYNQRPPAHWLEIVCSQGTLRWDNADGAVRLWAAQDGAMIDPRGATGWQVFPPPENFERNDLFLAEMRHFLAVARGQEVPACTLEDGLQALKLALSAQQGSYSIHDRPAFASH